MIQDHLLGGGSAVLYTRQILPINLSDLEAGCHSMSLGYRRGEVTVS